MGLKESNGNKIMFNNIQISFWNNHLFEDYTRLENSNIRIRRWVNLVMGHGTFQIDQINKSWNISSIISNINWDKVV